MWSITTAVPSGLRYISGAGAVAIERQASLARKFGANITIDLETSTKKSFKRLGNPFDPDNQIVYVGWAVGDEDPKMQRFSDKGMPPGWFGAMLNRYWPRLLLGINIKFDLLYLLRHKEDLEVYMQWVAAGGNVWDGQLAEYLLNGMAQEDHMLSMDELAPRYGGNTKFDEVKALWAAGVETRDIDPNLISRYLIGETSSDGSRQEGDIGNTRIIFQGQYERAKAAGQVKSILMNNGSLLCTVEMERNGMAVDVKRGRVIARELELQIAELVTELVDALPKDLPFDFNWGSAQQKSALLFGGPVKYKKWAPHLDEQGNQLYAMKDETHVLLLGGSSMEINEWHSKQLDGLTVPAAITYVSGKNAGEPKTKKIKVPDETKPKGAIKDFYYKFPGYTRPEKHWATSTPGQYSTGAEIILELGNRDIPFLQALARRTSLTKDLTTYYVTVNDKGEEVGMLTLVQADGIIHHALNHTSTVTGRFSSSAPNLQNLPKGNKSEVKTIFISRFKNGKVIQSDFSSLEIYVQAILTRCAQLIKDLQEGLDMHCIRVSQKKGISYEEAVRLAKGYVNEAGEFVPPVKEWEYERTKAKVFSFQRAYGAGADKISTSTKMPKEEVEQLIKVESERYPEIDTFNNGLIATLENHAEDTGLFVQHPDLPGATCHLKKAYWRAPDNKLYSWRQSPSPEYIAKRPASRGGKLSSFAPTEVKNYPVQGTGGEWAKAAMWLAIREFYARGNWRGLALLVNQVHDALYADADDAVAYEAAVVLHACMEEASTFMEWYFGWEVPVPVPSDTTWGSSMGDEGKLPDTFKTDVKEARKVIRAKYINNYTPTCERS